MRRWIKVPRSTNDSPLTVDGVTHHPGTASVDCYSQNPDGSAVKTGGYWTFEKLNVSDLGYLLKDSPEQEDKAGTSVRTFAFDADDEMFLIVVDDEGNLFAGEKNDPRGMVVYKRDEEIPDEFLAAAKS